MITALCRTVILYFLIMIGLRLMGKRQIGELEPSELVLTMMISDLATVPMQDFGIPLLGGVIPILTLLSLSLLLSQLSLHKVHVARGHELTDLRERQVENTQVADGVESGELPRSIVAVPTRLIDVCRVQQAHLLVMT